MAILPMKMLEENLNKKVTLLLKANSLESLNRPDIVGYRNKISSYVKPDHRNIAHLLFSIPRLGSNMVA